MQRSTRAFALSLALGSAVAVAGCAEPRKGAAGGTSSGVSAGELGALAPDTVLAEAGDVKITGKEASDATANEAYQLQRQLYEARRQWVENELAKRLIEREAKAENLDLEAFLAKKVEGEVKVTDSDVQMFYRSNPQMMRKPDGSVASLDEVKDKIREYLGANQKASKRTEYVRGLLEKSGYKIAMEPPEPPVVDVSVDDDPFKGPENAPVTIVEFSDFQCPACRSAEFRLPELLKKFEGKVKIVYRDFPLWNKHPQAGPTAVAANCAGKQDKYWEFHELAFQNQSQLGHDDLKRYAGQLKLDVDKWEKCATDPANLEEVRKDYEDGEKAGVNSTPTFFVNGRPVSGANIPEIARLIEKELGNSGT